MLASIRPQASIVCSPRAHVLSPGVTVMRLMVIAFVIVFVLIVDQYRFSGYFRQSLTDMIQTTVSRIVR